MSQQQRRLIANRAEMDARMEEVTAKFTGDDIPLPPFWGGYVVMPSAIEFWQGRAGRFHDRFTYARNDDGPWTIQRLMP
jgi:pyridoxamine 5'-phosphate oxidase